VTFPSVQLTQGVNEIFVRYGETSTVSSLPVYVLYTPVPYITDLRIDGEPFVDGGIYPREPRERFFITGKAPNATSVEIRLRGDTQRHFAVVANGEFYILVEDATVTRGSQTNFKLRPGNHEIDIIASNATSTYHVKRIFIYDNGYPFAYDVQLIETTNGNATHDLAASPTVTSKELKVTGKVKVNRTTIQSPGQPPQTVPEYIYGTIDTSSGVGFRILVCRRFLLQPPIRALRRNWRQANMSSTNLSTNLRSMTTGTRELLSDSSIVPNHPEM